MKLEEGVSAEDAAAYRLAREAECAKARLGFAMVEILSPRTQFAIWNDRRVNQSVKTGLGGDFKKVLHHKIPANAVPVLVRRDEIDLNSLVPLEGVTADIGDVVWLDLLCKIIIANGRHRQQAYDDFINMLQARIVKADADIEKVNKRGGDAADARIADLVQLKEDTRKRLSGLGTWLGTFYDIGELSSSVIHRTIANDSTDLLPLAAREYLSKNSTERVHMETEDEVLVIQLKAMTIAMDKDVSEPVKRGTPTWFQIARVASGVDVAVKPQEKMRRLMYSPLLLQFLIAIRPFGKSFTDSQFFNIPWISKVQGEFGGVSVSLFAFPPHAYPLAVQFFCTSMLEQIAEIDVLVEPVLREFKNSGDANLFENEDAMKDFLARPHSPTGCAEWKDETKTDWHSMYGQMLATYRSLKVVNARADRDELVKNGLLEIFTDTYNTHLRDIIPSIGELRKADDPIYQEAFEGYVQELVAAVSLKFNLLNATPVPGTFKSQLLSKLRFLTADVRGCIAARPIFCLPYAMDFVAEWAKYVYSIREVSLLHCPVHIHIQRILDIEKMPEYPCMLVLPRSRATCYLFPGASSSPPLMRAFRWRCTQPHVHHTDGALAVVLGFIFIRPLANAHRLVG